MALIRPLSASPTRRRTAVVLGREAALLLGATVFLALTARISVPLPFSPVPITGQTLGVLVVGALYGPRRGALAVVVYLLEGAAGAPVFSAGAAGLAVLMGPTGGYLFGFLPAAAFAGVLGGGSRPAPLRLLAMALASLAVYAVGVPWLATVTGMPIGAAVAAGLLPFLPGDTIKVIIAAGVAPAGMAVLARLGARPW